ncbi:MAG: MFS transporter [Bryobacteraceae bacterium]
MKTSLFFGLVVLFLINILNFYDRNIAGALAEPMKHEFHLSDSQIGLLSSAFIWLYAVVGVGLGWLADRLARKWILAIGVAVWAALTGLNALAQTFTHLIIARLGVAVGEAVVAPTATSWIGDLFPQEKRARALSVFMLGVPIGGALSYLFSGPAAQAFGWRTAMVLAAVPALVLVPLLLFLDEPPRGATEPHLREASGSMWSVLRIPTLWWIIASGALLNFNMYAYGTFMVSFFIRIHSQTLANAGVLTGVMYAIGGLAGAMLGGNLADRFVKQRRDARMLVAAAIALLGAPTAYLGIVQPKGSLPIALAMFTLAYGACNAYYGPVYSSIQDIVPPSMRARAMSIYFMLMYMMGASMGPLLTGRLSDWRAAEAAKAAGSVTIEAAHRATGLQEAVLIIPVLSFFLAIALWAGSRTIGRDMDSCRNLATSAAA